MKILIISLAGIGDALFAGPLIHELRLNFPEALIEALVRWPGARELLAGNPHLNAIHQNTLLDSHKAEALSLMWTLRKRGFDMTLNSFPQSRVEYRLVARAISAPVRISHDYEHWQMLTGMLVNRTLPPDYSVHCIDNNLALLGLAGAQPRLQQHEYELFLSAADRQWAESFIAQNGLGSSRLLGIHVGSGGTKNLALRRWPLPLFSQLIRQVNDAYRDVAVLLFGGPNEERDHARLLTAVDRKRVFAPRAGSFCQTAALLGKCGVFLSVDSVMMHLAAAMKVPRQIVIETPSWNKTVEPYNHSFALVRNPAVAGRNLEFYRYDGQGIRGTAEAIVSGMKSVTVDSVYRALREALKK